MEYRVTHYAVRFGSVQERLMYVGRSRMLARIVLAVVGVLFMQPLDMVALDRRRM
jgi:hypothetical protein